MHVQFPDTKEYSLKFIKMHKEEVKQMQQGLQSALKILKITKCVTSLL